MLDFAKEITPGVRRLSGGGNQRRIFSVDPSQKRCSSRSVGADQVHSLRRRRERDRWRIDDLKNIKTGGVCTERRNQKRDERAAAPARCIPAKKHWRRGCRIHFGAEPANETEEIPCS